MPAESRRLAGESAQCHILFAQPHTCIDCGAVPLDCGRRPRRPACALQAADIVAPAAGRGRPAQTRGSAPQILQYPDIGKSMWHWAKAPAPHLVLARQKNVETPGTD